MAKILVASISNRLIQWVSPFTSSQTGGGALAILESGILVLGFSGSGSLVLEFLEAGLLASGSGILVSGLLFCEKMVLDLLGHHCFWKKTWEGNYNYISFSFLQAIYGVTSWVIAQNKLNQKYCFFLEKFWCGIWLGRGWGRSFLRPGSRRRSFPYYSVLFPVFVNYQHILKRIFRQVPGSYVCTSKHYARLLIGM